MAGGQTARGVACLWRALAARWAVGSLSAVLPMSSTPLPFQRSFTALPSPLIPLGYVNAMVSPVYCELSIPLNP